MWWPFGGRRQASRVDQAEWVAKLDLLAQKIVKIRSKVVPDLVRSLTVNVSRSPELEKDVGLDFMVYALSVCERELRKRYGAGTPTIISHMLSDAVAIVLGRDLRDDIAAAQLRDKLRSLYRVRNEVYRPIERIRARKGESESGTLVDTFAKTLVTAYSKPNPMAQAVIGATGIEIAQTMPKFLDEVGLRG